MSVLLGMASKDERGRYSAGVAGDQTGKEVYIRPFYKRPWDKYIVFRSAVVREWFAVALERLCNNQNVGYDQSQRTTLWSECERIHWDISRISEIRPCECDCSSLMAVCARFARVTVNKNVTTRNLEQAFRDTGAVSVYSDRKYLDTDTYIQRGGILLNTQHHVAGVLTTGSGVNPSKPTNQGTILRVHSTGDAVKKMQEMLIKCGYSCGPEGADGIFGTGTYAALTAFQKASGLAVDGEYGPRSKAALQSAYNARTGRESVDTVAREVIAGRWGNNPERADRLEEAGYDAAQIQHRVDELLKK